jgi:hypothetical protein
MSTQLSPEFMAQLNDYLSNFEILPVKTFKYKCLQHQQILQFPIVDLENWKAEIKEEESKLSHPEHYKTKDSLIAEYMLHFFFFPKSEKLSKLIKELADSLMTPYEFLTHFGVEEFKEECMKHIPEQAEQVEDSIENFMENFKETRKKQISIEEALSDMYLVPEETTPVQGSSDQDEQVMNYDITSFGHDQGLVEVTTTQVKDISPLSEEQELDIRMYQYFPNTPINQYVKAVKEVHIKKGMKVGDLTLGSISKSKYFKYSEDFQLKKLNDHFKVIKKEVFENKPEEFKLFCQEFVGIVNVPLVLCEIGHTINKSKYCCVTGCIAIASAPSLNSGNSGPFTRLPSRRKKE